MSKLFAGMNQFPTHPLNPMHQQPQENVESNNGNIWDFQYPFGNGMSQFSKFGAGASVFPKLDMYHSPSDLTVVAEIPGLMHPEDISIFVEPQSLQISGQVTSSYGTVKRDHFTLSERHHGMFDRHLELPVPVKIRNATAIYRQGLLEIQLPKATGPYKSGGRRSVPIQVG